MSHVYCNTVSTVMKPPTLLVIIADSIQETGWCKQYTEEGYNVVHLPYPSLDGNTPLDEAFLKADKEICRLGSDWALITYGLRSQDAMALSSTMLLSAPDLKACIHFCPITSAGTEFLFKDLDGKYIPTIFHLPASQESLYASLLAQADPSMLDYPIPVSARPPIKIYTYPFVPATPPFPLLSKAPVHAADGAKNFVAPYIRSAINLSLSRTLELVRRCIGPYFDLEKLWERHIYFEFVERNAQKTMSTMVATPYVNHIPNMTGGVGHEDLARFYKHHFTSLNVTPPDLEMITVSRTVGSDRIVDEMIFKCTHTTEIDYFLPGIPPTGKPVEIALVGIIAFRGDKLYFEHLYWDQASVLAQLGLLDSTKLPVAGVESARKVLDPFGLPSNTLLSKWKCSEGKTTTNLTAV